MKSFKQYLKEYASAVRNEEDEEDEEDEELERHQNFLDRLDDDELADALTGAGEGGQAVRNAMQQSGLLYTPPEYKELTAAEREELDGHIKDMGYAAAMDNIKDRILDWRPKVPEPEGEDQKMLDTIAGSEDGQKFLSAMRAGGLTFDAKGTPGSAWPRLVDRYDQEQKFYRDRTLGK